MTNDAPKKRRKRSPNYPMFGLEEAIAKASEIYKANDDHYAPVSAIGERMGYSATSGRVLKAVAALIQYGLVEDKGAGDKRQVKVTDRFLDIHMYPEGSDKRRAALAEAALSPKLHHELWEKYNGKLPPTDDSIRLYLLREREDAVFNQSHVDGFLSRFRASLQLAGLSKGGNNSQENAGHLVSEANHSNAPEADSSTSNLQVGSRVQWTSQGKWMFPDPLPIARIDERDGEQFAYFEGKGHVPMSQLSEAAKSAPEAEIRLLEPVTTPAQSKRRDAREIGPRLSLQLSEDNEFELRLDKRISRREFDKLMKMIELYEDSIVEKLGAEEQGPEEL